MRPSPFASQRKCDAAHKWLSALITSSRVRKTYISGSSLAREPSGASAAVMTVVAGYLALDPIASIIRTSASPSAPLGSGVRLSNMH